MKLPAPGQVAANEALTRVLLAEDSEAKGYALERMLRQGGYCVRRVVTGEEGLKLAAVGDVDLIVLDVKLPGISGIEVCRILRSNPHTERIPVLHVSETFVAAEDQAKGLEMGADGYLTGPVEPPVLLATVRSLLRASRAERAQREGESVLRNFFESPGAMRGVIEVVADDDIRHIVANGDSAAFLGLTPEPMNGRMGSELGVPREAMRTWVGHYRESQRSGKPVSFEHLARYAGQETWLSATVMYLGTTPEGRPSFSYIVHDITERKRADMQLTEAMQRLDAHMQHSPLAVIEWGPDMRLIRWSREAERMFGWKAEEVLGKRIEDFRWVYEGDSGQVQAVSNDLRQGVQRFSTNRNYRKDGTVITCHWYNSTLVDEQGRFRSILSLVQDVTEQERTQSALRQAKAIAEAASRAKDQFIAVLSHELRTPLTPALAAIAAMQNDVRLPGDVREDLAMVQRNIALEVRLIADLLDVSRIISGKLQMERRRVDVAAAIREAAAIVGGDLDAKGQILTVQTPDAPYPAIADAARLQQVFWNLLRNAIKFTPERGRITVRATVVPAPHCPLAAGVVPAGAVECPASNGDDGQSCGGTLIVTVSDTGSGIAPEMLPRLFDAFEQAQEARSFGGLGLGLTICKAVVEMHGGSISAQSDGAGKGATFTVRLPVTECPLKTAVSPEAIMPVEEPAGADIGISRPLRILLVEDHADTARLLRRLLAAEGHEVTTADSVATGLAAAERSSPDVLISDLGLPDGTGLDLMRHLWAMGKRIPAIALSGYGTAADIEKSRAAGFLEHLVKPISSIDALMAAVARCHR